MKRRAVSVRQLSYLYLNMCTAYELAKYSPDRMKTVRR